MEIDFAGDIFELQGHLLRIDHDCLTGNDTIPYGKLALCRGEHTGL